MRRVSVLMVVCAAGSLAVGCGSPASGNDAGGGNAGGNAGGSGGSGGTGGSVGGSGGTGGNPGGSGGTGGNVGGSGGAGGNVGGSGGTGGVGGTGGSGGTGGAGGAGPNIPYVFVIAMENQDATGLFGVYGDTNAPYINGTLIPAGGHATAYGDVLPLLPSEPHYIWMEAGTNVFGATTFSGDADPSASNSTSDTNHLVTQLTAAGKTWRSYQENISGANCPVVSAAPYAVKHNPFVFFQDVSGSPPSTATGGACVANNRPYTELATDLANNSVAQYNFITPNLCHDMHGNSVCSNGCTAAIGTLPDACIGPGDTWLSTEVPPILNFINAHGGVLFIVWDEGIIASSTPFLVLGPNVKTNYASSVAVSHSSYVKTLEEIFGVPVSSRVTSANDFSDYFTAGHFP